MRGCRLTGSPKTRRWKGLSRSCYSSVPGGHSFLRLPKASELQTGFMARCFKASGSASSLWDWRRKGEGGEAGPALAYVRGLGTFVHMTSAVQWGDVNWT